MNAKVESLAGSFSKMVLTGSAAPKKNESVGECMKQALNSLGLT